MNFSFNKPPEGAQVPTTTGSVFGSGGFSFGGDANKPPAFNFGAPTSAPASNPMFGSPLSTAPAFGASPASQPSIFASPPAATPAQSSGFNFGQTSGGLSSFASPTTSSAAPGAAATSPFGAKSPWPTFGGTPTTAAVGFGQTTATTAAPAPAFGTPTNLNSPAKPAFSAPAPSFSLPAASSAPPNFNFGGGGIVQKTAAPTSAAPSFSFAPSPAAAGINMAQPSAAPAIQPQSGGFNFGQTPAPASTPAKPSFAFGGTTTSTLAPNVTITPVTSTTTSPFQPSFGGGVPAPTPASQVSTTFGNMYGPTPTPATTAPTIQFGATGSTPNLSFGKANVTTTNSTFTAPSVLQNTQGGFQFGGGTPINTSTPATSTPAILAALTGKPTSTPETKTSVPSFSLGNTPAQPAPTAFSSASSSVGFQLPTPPTQASTLPAPTSITPTSGLATLPVSSTLGIAPTTSSTTAPATTSATGFQLSLTSTSTVTPITGSQPAVATSTSAPAQPVPVTSMTFAQLEDAINKWSLELEEQEKVFINQATQVNAWDRLLIANGEKIVTLNESLQNVRGEQQSLDHELDFILGQQRELEELLAPLEKELGSVIISDPEREHTYGLADYIDTQLKQMSEHLKEIIEHLNESNKREDNNDPIAQIGRILNAHMSSLQWIDSSTAQISNKLDLLSNMHNTLKRRNLMSFNF